MKKILISAQWFWWGPVSKAISIINEIKRKDSDIEVVFVWLTNLKSFIESNKQNIDKVIYINTYDDIENYINTLKPDYSISVMEPYLVYYSNKSNINSYLVDSLNFFWDWKDFDIDVNNFDNIEPHNKQLIWYKLATKVFIQDLPWINKQYNFEKIIKSWYIIDIPLLPVKKNKKILISFCWLLSPVVDTEKSLIYIRFCMKILDSSFKELINNWYELHIVWNPKILSELKVDLNNIYTNFYSKSEYLQLLKESYFIIWPASLTSVLESLWCNTPYIILPEQHDWHFPNFNALNSWKNIFSWKMLSNYNSNLVNIKENSVNYIYETIKNFSNNREVIFDFSSYYLETIKKMFLDNEYKKSILKQKENLDFDNKKNWVEYIINNILMYENK